LDLARGDGKLFFVYVDEPFVLDILEWSKGKRGFGSVRVKAKTGKTEW
jgi:hypothetical protein